MHSLKAWQFLKTFTQLSREDLVHGWYAKSNQLTTSVAFILADVVEIYSDYDLSLPHIFNTKNYNINGIAFYFPRNETSTSWLEHSVLRKW